MRIVQLTPGTGDFHCGSCIRDHALVTALRRLGHEVLMAPLYLPHVVDESADPRSTRPAPVFFGGINVYLQQKSALFRRTPVWLDRMLDAPGLLRWAARRAGLTKAQEVGELTVSMLRGEEGRQAKELDKLVTFLKQDHRPDVVSLSNAMLVGVARRVRGELGAVVVCSLQGEESFLDGLPEPQRDLAWKTLAERCRDVEAFIAPSAWYGRRMGQRLGVEPARMHVVYNGIALEDYVAAAAPPQPPAIGYLARLCRAKGLHTLVEAFVQLKKRGGVPGLRLRIAGAQTAADAPFVAEMRQRLAEAGVAGDVEIRPNVDRAGKQELLRSISVLSVPATYGEAFGLYLVEAWACGVPVVQPRSGAFPELLEASGAGVLCEPDDAASLADALEALLLDGGRAQELSRRARQAAVERFGVEDMARGFAQVCAAARNPLPAGEGGVMRTHHAG